MPERSYDCFTLRQRLSDTAPELVVFHAPAGELLEWCAVRRLETEVAAPQRPESKSKVNALARFLKGDPRNVIPTAVIIAVSTGGTAKLLPPKQGAQHPVLSVAVPDAQ